MAFIHTNFLTGNDTTGDGSTALPYKTVFKALGLAASNDTIKVAGGQWVPVTGDFTFTYSSITVDTSVSQVGIINVDDIITFEDGQYGFDKFHYRVSAVTTTTLTLATTWGGPTQIVAGISKLNSYDYSTTGTTAFETWNTTAIQPAGRTNVTISGGWNPGYTDNSNGWTVARKTGSASAALPIFNATTYLGDWKQNLVFDKFMISRIGALLSSTGTPSFAVDKFAFADAPASSYGWSSTNTGVGLFQKDANTPVSLFATGSGQIILTSMNAYSLSVASIISTETKITFYGTAGATTTNGNSNVYFALGTAGSTSMGTQGFQYNFLQGSPNKITIHFRISTYALYFPIGTSQFNTFNGGNAYFSKINFYVNAAQPSYFNLQVGTSMQVEDMEILGPYANQGAFSYGTKGQTLIDLSQEGKLIESFNSSTSGFDYPDFPEYAYGNLSRLVCQNLYAVQVKDAEGLKTIDPFGSIYFKDPINDELRIQAGGCYTEGAKNYKVIGVYEKPQAAFSATFRLKRGAVDGEWNKIGIQYGPNAAQIVTQAVTLTESYADYILTVDPTTIADWNTFPFPLYFGIYSNTPFIPDPAYTPTFCYVDSINIT
jgi:hypothetical protein